MVLLNGWSGKKWRLKKQRKTVANFVLLAKRKTNTIILREITQATIDILERKLQKIFNSTGPIPGT